MNSFRRKKINLVKMGQTAIKFTPFVIPIMCSIESNAMLNKGPRILSITSQLLKTATRSSQNVSSPTSIPSKLNIDSIAKRLRQSSTYTPTSSGPNQPDFIPLRSLDTRSALGAMKDKVVTSSFGRQSKDVKAFISKHTVFNIPRLTDDAGKTSYSISKTNTSKIIKLFEQSSSTSTISHSNSPSRLNINSIGRELRQSSTYTPTSSDTNQPNFIPLRSLDSKTALGFIKNKVALSSFSKRNPSDEAFILKHTINKNPNNKTNLPMSKTNITKTVKLFKKLSSTSTISDSKSTSTPSKLNIPLITKQLQQSSTTSPSSYTATPSRTRVSLLMKNFEN